MDQEYELSPCMWFSCADTMEVAINLRSYAKEGWRLTDLQVYHDEGKPYLVTMRPEVKS